MLEQVLLILLVLMSAAIIALLWMLAGGVRRSGAKTGEDFRLYNQSARLRRPLPSSRTLCSGRWLSSRMLG